MPPKLNPLEAIKQSKGAKAVMSLADEVRAEMAAEKAYKAGVHYADPNVKPTMKFSEALGITGSEGKTLNFTETDRSRVKGENMGGFGFSGLQHYSPKHRDANAVWGFGSEEIAKRKIKNSDPEKTVFTTYIGSPDQHKSNSIVVKDALKNVQAANQQNLIHPEQIKLINKRIREARNKNGTLLFPSDFDITDPQAMNAATTFDRRSAISNALMGVGVQGPMRGLDFRKANPNVEYKDPAQMDAILRRESEPMLEGLPNYSVGPRLFTFDGGLLYRPDLNFAFPHQPTGTDMGVMFDMPTIREAAPDFIKKKGYKPNDVINARAMSMGAPSQFVSEDYLTYLQKIGRKKGGLATMAKGGAARGMKKLKGIYNEVETSMGRGKGAEFEQSASPLNIMREGTGGQFVTKHMDKQLQDIEDQAFSPAYQKMVEESLKADRARAAAGDKAAQLRIPTFEKLLAEGLAKRQWVNSNLKNYVKKQMGSPDDPVRALAEKGVSHVKKLGNRAEELKPYIQNKRKQAGLPQQGLAQSDEAKIWETLSDNTLFSKLPAELPSSVVREDEWMKNLPAGEKVMLYGHEPDLGFQDLIGDIERRMDAGQLRPDQLNKVTVADTVKSLHDERVRKEENSLRAMQNNAATKLHKEYPSGYKWVEISANKDSPLPEGWEQLPNGTYVDPQGQGSIHNPNYIALQEALEHEGDIMGHCVGDYCDDVYKEGTRILSLRDPRGESHATVQVIPEQLYPVEWFSKLPEAEQRAIEAAGYTGYNVRHSPQFKEAQAKVPPRIKQIKGKQDEPLVKKYQSMMADIANTGDYSFIDELHNAGLKEKSTVLDAHEEAWLKSKGYQVPKYLLQDDIDVMLKALDDNGVPPIPEAGMAKGGMAHMNKGGLKGGKGAQKVMSLADQVRAEMAAEKQYGQISGMVSKIGEEGRSPILPVPNRWFLQPDKFPNQQKLIERVLQKTGMRREDFPSGAFIDPRTGEVLDSRIMDDLGVVIDPKTNRPMMSAKGQSGLEVLDPKTGAYTKSNLVRKGLFKPEGGDPMLNDLNFIATIEKGDAGHRYGLATEYASPTELYNTGTGANPTLRPRSRGDLFGVGDVVGQVRIGKSNPHDVYEKLFVAPKGSDVQGKKLSKAHGGLAHMAKGGRGARGAQKVMSLADQVRAEMAAEKAGTKAPKKLFLGEDVASDAIGKAAQSAGMKAPVTANKPLTGLQDFHTSLGDSVRARAIDAQKQMDSWDYKYAPGQYVFTEDGAKRNLPPLKILQKSRAGWNIMREDMGDLLSKKIIDPETGKAKRTPYEPGYKVRLEHSPDNWSEFVIPESAIKGNVDMARGGLAYMGKGGAPKGVKKVMSLADQVRAEMAMEKGVLPAAEREANLDKFLSTSQEKRRLYHATPANFKEFQGKGFDPTISGNATWLTPNKEKQPAAHNTSSKTDVYREGVNVMPVHVKAEKPLVLDDRIMEDWAKAAYANDSPEFPFLLAPEWLKKIKEDGYDSIFHPRSGEVIMLEPNKIKSAIGNRGTYDINDPDITKAHGGLTSLKRKVA